MRPERRAESDAATDQIPSTDEGDSDRSGEGRMEGASRADNLAESRFPQAGRSRAGRAGASGRRRSRADDAHAADPPRSGAAARLPLDLRRTIHRNISHGGVPISLIRRQHKEKPLRLVVLLDASAR
jgi:uncharacterized protein with von Willebrand factor type A (vWA) domain